MINKKSNILIVGLGLIGGSYAKGLSKNGYTVSAIDLDEQAIEFAVDNGYIIDEVCTNEEKIARADLIIFALYPRDIVKFIEDNKKIFKNNALLTDVSGVKVNLLNGLKKILPENVRYISHHPMAGKERKGVFFADETIFENANFIITPFDLNEDVSDIELIGRELKFKNIEVITPEEHDVIIGYLSQLTHAIAISLMNARDLTHMMNFTGDSFRDLTRIASINDALWSELFLENKDNLIAEIDMFKNELDVIKEALVNNDKEALIKEMKESTTRRELFKK